MNALTDIRAISKRLPLPSPHSRAVVLIHCLTALCLAGRVRWSLFCLGVYSLSMLLENKVYKTSSVFNNFYLILKLTCNQNAIVEVNKVTKKQ